MPEKLPPTVVTVEGTLIPGYAYRQEVLRVFLAEFFRRVTLKPGGIEDNLTLLVHCYKSFDCKDRELKRIETTSGILRSRTRCFVC